MRNNNCLQGLACPKCGNYHRLIIEVASLASITDQGTDVFGDIQWYDSSYCECPDCWHRGTVADFQTPSQEEVSIQQHQGGAL